MDGYIADQHNLSEPEVSDKLEALDIEWQILFIILYTCTSVLALFENIIVIFVQLFGKSFEPILRMCLINLAIADICIGVLSVPFSYTDFMLGQWIFPHFMCPVSQFSIIVSVFVTCFTLTLISLERYLSIVHPIYHSVNSERIQSISWKLLLMGWLIGCILSGLSVKFCEIKPFVFKDQIYYDCRMMFSSDTIEKSYVLSIFILTFVLPLLLQSAFYSLIALKLRRLRETVSIDKIKIIKMLAILIITFAICWLPIRLFFLVVMFNKEIIDFKTKTAYHIYVFTFFGAHFLSMFNSCINPIIYCFMSEGFRDDYIFLINKFRTTQIVSDRVRMGLMFGSTTY